MVQSNRSRLVPDARQYPSLSRRGFLQLGGFGALALAIGACGPGDDDNGTTNGSTGSNGDTGTNGDTNGNGAAAELQSELSELSIVTYNPNYANQVPYRMAQSFGWYEEYGIEDIEVIISEEVIPGLMGGGALLAHGDTDLILGSAEESGAGIKYLATFREAEWFILGVGPQIESPEDLVGATLSGGQIGSRNEHIVKEIVRNLGVDPDEVNWVPVGGGSDGRLQAIFAGSIDGTALQIRHKTPLEEQGGRFLYEEQVSTPQEGIAVMQSTLDANPDAVTAWLAADIRTRQYALDDSTQDEIMETMRGIGFEIPDAFEEGWLLDRDVYSPDGGFNTDEMDALVDEFKDFELLPQSLEWREHVDLEPLWAAQDLLGLDRRPASL